MRHKLGLGQKSPLLGGLAPSPSKKSWLWTWSYPSPWKGQPIKHCPLPFQTISFQYPLPPISPMKYLIKILVFYSGPGRSSETNLRKTAEPGIWCKLISNILIPGTKSLSSTFQSQTRLDCDFDIVISSIPIDILSTEKINLLGVIFILVAPSY